MILLSECLMNGILLVNGWVIEIYLIIALFGYDLIMVIRARNLSVSIIVDLIINILKDISNCLSSFKVKVKKAFVLKEALKVA